MKMIVLKISLDKSFVYLSKNSVFNYSLILTQKDATREFRTRTELVSVQIYILARKPLPADPGGGVGKPRFNVAIADKKNLV